MYMFIFMFDMLLLPELSLFQCSLSFVSSYPPNFFILYPYSIYIIPIPIDCGAGIGRVSKNLLLPRCRHVDLIEQSPRLLQSSAGYLGPEGAGRTTQVTLGLQDFKPAPNTYDLIWIQWVIGQLDDLDFVRFFRRCTQGLTEHGIVGKYWWSCCRIGGLLDYTVVLYCIVCY
jgi:hypothetical protein